MDDREIQNQSTQPETDSQQEPIAEQPSPVQDMEVFTQLRDVVRTHYLWRWSDEDEDTLDAIRELAHQIAHDPQFRLVGEIEVDDDTFEITLWMEETMAYSLASVDIAVMDALQIDFGRCAILARELTRIGLEYHLLTFGDGRAQQFRINIVGPRMQQIRNLGTLVAGAVDSYSA